MSTIYVLEAFYGTTQLGTWPAPVPRPREWAAFDLYVLHSPAKQTNQRSKGGAASARQRSGGSFSTSVGTIFPNSTRPLFPGGEVGQSANTSSSYVCALGLRCVVSSIYDRNPIMHGRITGVQKANIILTRSLVPRLLVRTKGLLHFTVHIVRPFKHR